MDAIWDGGPPAESECCVLHLMGPHAGENNDEIFARKQLDIQNTNIAGNGHTVWVTSLTGDRLESIRGLMARQQTTYVYFINAGGKDFKTDGVPPPAATGYKSISGLASSLIPTEWTPLPDELGPVTGKTDMDARRKAMWSSRS
jgi:hypothetical protein